MYIFKNAIISITRNKGRNILIGIIILVIACTSSVTLAIRNSANTLIKSYEEKYDVVATIGTNREKLMGSFDKDDKDKSKEEMVENFNNIESVTVDDIINYGQSEYVKSYYYTESVSMNASNIEKVSMDFETDENSETNGENAPDMKDNPMGDAQSMPGGDSMSSADFTITGYSSYEAMSDFISGSYTIEEGEISDDFSSNSCVINSELATLNGISVGDTITLTSPNDETITYELKVTGIYTDNSESSDNMMDLFSNSANNIITNVQTVENIASLDTSITNTINPSFVLTSKDVIDAFESEIASKGLSEYLSVSTNLDEVESATDSISNLKTFATTFLIITLVIGAVVLFVINMINIKERKYEIGVLRTIGMKKSILTMQFMVEVLIVAIVALLIGGIIGACISVPTANKLLESEISSSQESMEDVKDNFGKGGKDFNMDFDGGSISGITSVNEVDSINAVVDFKVMLQLLGIGILLTCASSVASMISIQRFSPLTILKERS